MKGHAAAVELAEALQKYFDNGGGPSLSALAKRTGVPYSTLRRFIKGEMESKPEAENVVALVDAIMTNTDKVTYLKNHYPKIGDALERCYPTELQDEGLSERVRKYLYLEPHNLIFNLAATSKGTTHSQIEKLRGQN